MLHWSGVHIDISDEAGGLHPHPCSMPINARGETSTWSPDRLGALSGTFGEAKGATPHKHITLSGSPNEATMEEGKVVCQIKEEASGGGKGSQSIRWPDRHHMYLL